MATIRDIALEHRNEIPYNGVCLKDISDPNEIERILNLDINAVIDEKTGQTVLLWAILKDQQWIMRLEMLLDLKPDVNLCDKQGLSPFIALVKQHVIARYVYQTVSLFKIYTADNFVAHFEKQKFKILKRFLEQGLNVHYRDRDHKSALDHCIEYSKLNEITLRGIDLDKPQYTLLKELLQLHSLDRHKFYRAKSVLNQHPELHKQKVLIDSVLSFAFEAPLKSNEKLESVMCSRGQELVEQAQFSQYGYKLFKQLALRVETLQARVQHLESNAQTLTSRALRV